MHQYISVQGMTCEACQYKIEHLLAEIPGVQSVRTQLKTGEVELVAERLIPESVLQEKLKPHSKYQLGKPSVVTQKLEEEKSFLETYQPILLVFGLISLTTFCTSGQGNLPDLEVWMRHFMAGFFLVFSFFKLLNLKAFADAYVMYDLPARFLPGYAWFYPFLELGLGMAYVLDWHPFETNLATAILMTLSLPGVLLSVLNKKKIRCACLGTVFQLPMSFITIVEDSLMLLMALWMLWG